MKRIRLVEIWANIKANLVAFLSIAMFVSLGIGLFLGIQWTAAGLRDAASAVMEEGSMHDIMVSFPYGITESDLKAIKGIEGVTEAEYSYTSFNITAGEKTNNVFKMQSLTKSINTPLHLEGKLPTKKNEACLLKFWANKNNVLVGDTITLEHDATAENDADGMEYLTADTFTVTGLVDSAEYLYKDSNSYGISNIGSGRTDCVAFVTEDAFDKSAFHDAYPTIYVRCKSMEGIDVFSDNYHRAISPIVSKITELGGTLANARYNDLHNEAQEKIDEAQRKIDDGEKQLTEGQKVIEEGEQQLIEGQERIDAGQKELLEGVSSGTAQQKEAQAKLQEALVQLTEGQARYDDGLATYNKANDAYNQANDKFNAVRDKYDELMRAYSMLSSHRSTLAARHQQLRSAYDAYLHSDSEEGWPKVQAAFDGLLTEYQRTMVDLSNLPGNVSAVASALGASISIGSPSTLSTTIFPDSVDTVLSESQRVIDELARTEDAIENATFTVDDVTIRLTDIPGGLQQMADKLAQSKAELDDAKGKLDAGWGEYHSGKAAYDAAVAEAEAKLSDGEKQLEEGKAQIEEKTAELEEGKAQLEEKTAELEEGKAKLEDAKSQLNKMVEYEWLVLPRQASAAVQALISVSNMLDNVKWAMASLFILVGLFVCYSAISRLVHEQITQIGTKKALGFRQREITLGYLAFSALAVLLGIIISVGIALFIVQSIIIPRAAAQFTMPQYEPYFSLPDVLAMGSMEFVLILCATWFAIHGLLKRHAVDLLKGESTASAKAHFYERTRIWKRMSLFSQTVVNNCVNDKRRVIGTLVGVVGCTALIVTAVTLYENIQLSLEEHYDSVYSYDALACLSEESTQKAESVALALYNRGIMSSPAYTSRLQVRHEDGARSIASIMVPTNEYTFAKMYHVVSTDGQQANIDDGGLWVSAAYGEHYDVKPGDKFTLTEFNGKTHTFTIAGFFNYYLTRHEFVLSKKEYGKAFGDTPQPNVLLVNLDGASIDDTRKALKDVNGFESLEDDRERASHNFSELTKVLSTVVLVYLLLSGMMALMVLLNLDIMFVDEKKRELIVLMICGFSAKDAKAYIYRDSIVLTILGIVIGILLGTIMGAITIYELEPPVAYWIKGFNWIAALAGAVGAGLFATLVLLFALRRIPRFDLTDINRF